MPFRLFKLSTGSFLDTSPLNWYGKPLLPPHWGLLFFGCVSLHRFLCYVFETSGIMPPRCQRSLVRACNAVAYRPIFEDSL